MRTENSIKNIIMNFLYNILNYGLRFISRIIFVKTLAEVYLGVNGLLSNVLGILSLTELGIGTAIGYSLYEPLAKKDNDKISSLMQFYKKAYHIIAIIVLLLGLVLLPVLPYLIKDTADIENLNIIYIIFLLNAAFNSSFVLQIVISAFTPSVLFRGLAIHGNTISSGIVALEDSNQLFGQVNPDFIAKFCISFLFK